MACEVIRVELADGSAFENIAVDGWVITFVPFQSPRAWVDEATIRFLDHDDAEIARIECGFRPSRH